jgi:16S rRNA (cytidine1402-2'-O)-methyltransferase
VFEGFLPRKGSGRTQRLSELAAERRTVVLYEAPHRVARTLVDIATAFGADRRVAIARELTKLHEEVWRGTIGDAIEWIAHHEPRGEFVIVLDGAPAPADATDEDVRVAVDAALGRGLSPRDAAAVVATALGVPKRRAYAAAIDVQR